MIHLTVLLRSRNIFLRTCRSSFQCFRMSPSAVRLRSLQSFRVRCYFLKRTKTIMKAAYIEKTGSPDVIQYGDLPDPTCGPEQVLLQVGAVSVNPIDTYIRNGANYWPLPQPFIVGCDVAGTIIQVGTKVRHLEPGQRVWGSNQGLLGRQGTFSTLASIDAVYSTCR